MSQLDAFIKGRLRARWHARAKGHLSAQPDLVDHLMHSLEVCHADFCWLLARTTVSVGFPTVSWLQCRDVPCQQARPGRSQQPASLA